MSELVPVEAGEWLRAWRRDGDGRAQDQLMQLFYPWMRDAAAAMLRRERHVSLATGDLAHEAFLRLIALKQVDWQDRAHFMALASTMLRRALMDHLRAKRADKRAHQKVTLVTHVQHKEQRLDVRSLHHALLRLGAIDPEKAEIVEMRYFGGMSIADIAAVTGLSEPTVKRRWTAARAWLLDAMETDA